jgi:hypothetical protein
MSVRTMARVWAESRHGGSLLLMLLAIADFADDEGNAYPAVGTLATKCRMSSRNANYVLAQLQDSGELVINGGGPRGTNRYRITLLGMNHTAPLKPVAPLKPASEGGCNGLQEGGEAGFLKPLKPASDKPSGTVIEPSGNLFPNQPSAASGGKSRKTVRQAQPGKTVPTWEAYASAFRSRYNADPIRSKKVNSQLALFVNQVGAEEAPQVAAHFLSCEDPFYVNALHPVDLLLRDAQKVRTLWKTGRHGGRMNAQESLEASNLSTAARFLARTSRHSGFDQMNYGETGQAL